MKEKETIVRYIKHHVKIAEMLSLLELPNVNVPVYRLPPPLRFLCCAEFQFVDAPTLAVHVNIHFIL